MIEAERGRTAAVMAAIRERIASRGLGPGDKLPSIRRLAAVMKVSPSTVADAYDRLAAEAVIRSRPGSGFYVLGSAPPRPVTQTETLADRAIDPFWVSRLSLDASTDAPKPGCGWLPTDWMPEASLRRAVRAFARAAGPLLADYGGTRGSPALRELLARRLATEGIEAGRDSILLTSSGTQAIDLVCRLLLRPGDVVLVDDPCYFNFQALLRAHRVAILGVAHTATGPDPAALASALERHRPRLYLTNSGLHNPTGATLSWTVAHKVLAAASAHDLVIVEDDIFGDFEPDPSPRLAALDGLAGVIRIGSFSKTLSASIRCGYVAARPDWIEALVDLQVATSFGAASPMAAELVLAALRDGSYRKHMEAVRLRLDRARQDVAGRLARLGIQPWLMPRGGPFLWCRLPEGLDSAALARAALAEDVVLAPGNVFSVGQNAAGFMRFNVAQMGDPGLDAALERWLDAVRAGGADRG